MRCIYRFGMYAVHALYICPPYAIESRWSRHVRGLYAVRTPLAPWICNDHVLMRDIIRSGIAIDASHALHVRHPCAIDTQLIRNICEIVAPEMFHQTISAILLRICSFFRTPYERRCIAGQCKRGLTDWTCCHGPHLHALLRIIRSGVSGLATDSPCGVWAVDEPLASCMIVHFSAHISK